MVSKQRVYSPYCAVCQYMKRNKPFTEAVLLSTYFSPKGAETLPEVMKRFKDPFPIVTMYAHCNRHMKPAISRWFAVHNLAKKSREMVTAERAKQVIAETMEVIEEHNGPSVTDAEKTLDLIIKKGMEMVERGELSFSMANLNQTIKIKTDMENRNKDRRYDALKQLFAGAAPKDETKTLPDVPAGS